jgi:hypothetical protein
MINEEAITLDFVTEPYNFAERNEFRIPPHSGEIPYNWELGEGQSL